MKELLGASTQSSLMTICLSYTLVWSSSYRDHAALLLLIVEGRLNSLTMLMIRSLILCHRCLLRLCLRLLLNWFLRSFLLLNGCL